MLVILLKRNLKIAEKKFRIKSFLSPNLENNLNVITPILSFGAKKKQKSWCWCHSLRIQRNERNNVRRCWEQTRHIVGIKQIINEAKAWTYKVWTYKENCVRQKLLIGELLRCAQLTTTWRIIKAQQKDFFISFKAHPQLSTRTTQRTHLNSRVLKKSF